MKCELIEIDKNTYQCKKCNFTIKSSKDPSRIIRSCGPSTIQKVVNLTSTMMDYATSGFENSTDSEKNRRLEICQSCTDHYVNGSCNLCGCDMNLKTRIETASCPIGKW